MWEGSSSELSKSNWFPQNRTLFQVKATEMGPTACGEEIVVRKDGTVQLKSRIKLVVEPPGAYVLFYGMHCEGQMATSRTDEILSRLVEVVGTTAASKVKLFVYGAEKIAAWASEHASAVSLVKDFNGKQLIASMQSWDSWSRTQEPLLEFEQDEKRQITSKQILASLDQPRAVVRLAALSGLGKTRLAFELFRPPVDRDADIEQYARSSGCVYIADGSLLENTLDGFVLAMRDSNVSATLIIDECPLHLHRRLADIISSPTSKMKLLTLDFDPFSDPKTRITRFFSLDQMEGKTIEQMLKVSSPEVPSDALSKIAAFSQGFPRMAKLMVDAVSDGDQDIWKYTSAAHLIQKLVLRRSSDKNNVLRVARALATFEHLGTTGAVSHELDIFCAECCALPKHEVESIIEELADARIVYRRGDYIRLTPLPIAVSLAGEFWSACSAARMTDLFAGGKLTEAMVEATGNPLSRLKNNAKVQQLVASICGPGMPFRERDQLTTTVGSRLVSSLAEVNPKAVCQALTLAFASMRPEDAGKLVTGRRDLVICLTKLAWWPETFDDASWLLLVFASGENEKWENNAKGTFISLFHVYLSGTETPAVSRLPVLRRALARGRVEYDQIVCSSLLEAFEAGHFSRVSISDAQGGAVLNEDWKPKGTEVFTYWQEAFDLLKPFRLKDGELGDAARRGFASKSRGIILWGGLRFVRKACEVVLSRQSYLSMLEELRSALNYGRPRYSAELQDAVVDLINTLVPTSFVERLTSIVATPSWSEMREDADGEIMVVAEERARELAGELSSDIGQLEPYLATLLTGEQRQAQTFGYELGCRLASPIDYLRLSVRVLSGLPMKERNSALSSGLALAACRADESATREFVRSMFQMEGMSSDAVQLLATLKPADADIEVVLNNLANGSLKVGAVRILAFGRALEGISDHAASDLIDECMRHGAIGASVALELISMRSHTVPLHGPLLTSARAMLLDKLLIDGLLAEGTMFGHYFGRLTEQYLSKTSDEPFVFDMARNLVAAIAAGVDFSKSSVVRKLLTTLLRGHVALAWPALRDGFEDPKSRSFLRICFSIDRIDLVDLVGIDRLLAWCDGFPESRTWVPRLGKLLREPTDDGAYPRWTEFAQSLLRDYGSDRDVRNAIAASIATGSWAGSAVPRLKAHAEAYRELISYPVHDVSEWAMNVFASLEGEIVNEQKRDDEHEFGIYK